MPTAASLFIVGDVHGQIDRLTALLQSAGLTGRNGRWAGGAAHLWFLGDFVDRGPDGVGVLDLVMRLQTEAASARGRVGALLGNHDVLLLSAKKFGLACTSGVQGSFYDDWLWNGGNPADLARLAPRHAEWITGLPAMARVGDRLLIHADSTFYQDYGRSAATVNRKLKAILQGQNPAEWDRLLGDFTRRREFLDERSGGAEAAMQFLLTYGGKQLVHGHTPIGTTGRGLPREIVSPYVYADGLCVNVDGGLFLGEPGFVWQVPG